MTENDRNSLIGLLTIIAVIVAALVIFPPLRDMAVVPFVFLYNSAAFIFESIGSVF